MKKLTEKQKYRRAQDRAKHMRQYIDADLNYIKWAGIPHMKDVADSLRAERDAALRLYRAAGGRKL